jgi:hypothetical protein
LSKFKEVPHAVTKDISVKIKQKEAKGGSSDGDPPLGIRAVPPIGMDLTKEPKMVPPMGIHLEDMMRETAAKRHQKHGQRWPTANSMLS